MTAQIAHCNYAVVNETAKGFRLPTSMEWEMAARYIGPDQPTVPPLKDEAIYKSGVYWTPGSYASGATGPFIDKDADDNVATQEAAWCKKNSSSGTQAVGQKPCNGNGLGLYDISGNVYEWCFDRCTSDDGTIDLLRRSRGGCWEFNDINLQVGHNNNYGHPGTGTKTCGFRLVRSE